MELVAFFGLLPYIIFGLIVIAFLAEDAFLGAAIATFLLLIWTMIWYGFMPVWNWVTSNPVLLIEYLCVYGVLGLASTFFLWDRFCARKAKYWRENMKANEAVKKDYLPVWSNHKSKLTAWFVWWPFSIANYILGRMVKDFVEWVLKQFGNAYTLIAQRHFN